MGTDRHPGYDSPAGPEKSWTPPTLRSTIERYLRDEGWTVEPVGVWVRDDYRLTFRGALDRQMLVEATRDGRSTDG